GAPAWCAFHLCGRVARERWTGPVRSGDAVVRATHGGAGPTWSASRCARSAALARSPPMRTIRVFVSSPGDVEEERARARRAIERVSAWFAGRAIVKPVLWEDAPLRATASFQAGID